jgi:pre-rRNA-processing protein IPI3
LLLGYFCRVNGMTGRLLKKWRAHYRTVTCLVFTEDDSLLVSGSEDVSVRVWSLLVYVLRFFIAFCVMLMVNFLCS